MFHPSPYPLAAFDIEIRTELPDDRAAWASCRPYGVACAGFAREEPTGGITFEFVTDMAGDAAGRTLDYLLGLVAGGWTVVGFNSASFDFDVLAEEVGPGRRQEVIDLCLGHIDLIHVPLCHSGYKKSLDSCCAGSGVAGKAHAVELNDGTLLESMSGKDAPRLWGLGERSAVLAYLKEDVRSTLELAQAARLSNRLSWVTSGGRLRSAQFERLFTVREALEQRMPSQHWMEPPYPSPAADMEWTHG